MFSQVQVSSYKLSDPASLGTLTSSFPVVPTHCCRNSKKWVLQLGQRKEETWYSTKWSS